MATVNSKNYRIGVVTLLTLCNFVNAMDRASLSVAAPFIIRDFHINTVEMGIALSAFFWTYVLFNVPGGNLADRFGAKKVLGWSVAIWSICSALTGIVRNVFQVVVARIGVGIGEAAILPCNAKITASTFSSKERGTVMSIASGRYSAMSDEGQHRHVAGPDGPGRSGAGHRRTGDGARGLPLRNSCLRRRRRQLYHDDSRDRQH